MRRILLALAVLAAATVAGPAASPAEAATPIGPAATPPMGWNSWNKFGCNIDENLIKGTADAIVGNGLDKVGYKYVNIDDCWMASTRDSNGNLRADPTRFPSGIKALADYVHAKGLKLGIYESAGTATCQGLPGSLDHETADANSFAAWGVDYLKYDNCNHQGRPALARYKAMGDALRATGRPIVYSLCNWGLDSPWLFGPATGASLWRTTGDISDSWGSMTSLLDQQNGLEPFARPHGWNDPDMLEVGNGGMTDAEYRAHFSLWSLLNSPLILGNDLRSMSTATRQIITNTDVIAVNQDWGGSQGRRVRDFGATEVWAKPMSDGSVATVLFNRTSAPTSVSTSASELGLGGSSSYSLKDLWTGATSTSSGAISASVPSHGAVMYRVTRGGSPAAPLGSGTHQVSDLSWLASSNGWGPVERDRSNGEQAAGDGRTLTIGSATYSKGLGVHADSAVHVWLGGSCSRFTAKVGVDSEVGSGRGSVRFAVYGDGRLLAYSDVKNGGQAATALGVPTGGVKALELRVTDARDGINYDHADWADAQVACTSPGTGRYVSDATWTSSANGWGPAERDQSNGEQPTGDGGVLSIGGVNYPKGVGAHAASDVAVASSGCERFVAVVGIDAETGGRGSVSFQVTGDGATLYSSGTITAGSAVVVDVDVTGRSQLHLVVGNGGDTVDYDHADWGAATLLC